MGNGSSEGLSKEDIGKYPTQTSEEQMKKKLSAKEFNCLRRAGTEPGGQGKYCSFFPKKGYLKCKACDYPLYSAGSKFKDCGWDAYDKCFYSGDTSHVMLRGSKGRAECACANCGSHLGHVFFGEHQTKTNERH